MWAWIRPSLADQGGSAGSWPAVVNAGTAKNEAPALLRSASIHADAVEAPGKRQNLSREAGDET